MPLRMTAGTILYITGISFMSSFSESFADSLGFFASNKDFHFFSASSFSNISLCRFRSIAVSASFKNNGQAVM